MEKFDAPRYVTTPIYPDKGNVTSDKDVNDLLDVLAIKHCLTHLDEKIKNFEAIVPYQGNIITQEDINEYVKKAMTETLLKNIQNDIAEIKQRLSVIEKWAGIE